MSASEWKALSLRAVVLLSGLLLVSVLPKPWKELLSTHGVAHPIVHMLAFCVVFLLIAGRAARLRTVLALALILFAFGVLTEALQSHVYRTPLERDDIANDGAGLVLGLFCREVLSKPHIVNEKV